MHAFTQQELRGGVEGEPLEDVLEVDWETLPGAYDLDGFVGMACKRLEVCDTIPGKEGPGERPVEPG